MPMRSASPYNMHQITNGFGIMDISLSFGHGYPSPFWDKIDNCKDANQGSYANKDLAHVKRKEPMYLNDNC